MIFTQDQIKELLSTIDLQTTYLIGHNLGHEALTSDDLKVLRHHGINPDTFKFDYPPYLKAFLWGRLAALLNERQASTVTYRNFLFYVQSRQWQPLSRQEKSEYEIARQQSYSHIKSFGDRFRTGFSDSIFSTDQASRLEQEKVLAGELEAGILNRRNLQQIVTSIGQKTKDYTKDWNMIVNTELQDIYNRGKAVRIIEDYGEEQLVYKDTYAGACRWCIRLHTTSGIGSEPRVFTIEELYANGTNIGKRKDQWKAVVGVTHPYCFDDQTEVLTNKGWKYFFDVTGEEQYLSVDLATNDCEWVDAVRKVEYKYDGPMDVFKGNDYDLKTTPHHRHVVNFRKGEKDLWELKPGYSLKPGDRLLRNITNYHVSHDKSIEIGGHVFDRLVMSEFMAYYLSDGNISAATASYQSQIKITQSKEKSNHYQTMFLCCKKLFKKVWAGKDAIYIPLNGFSNDFIASFYDLGHCHEKYIPKWIKNSDKNTLSVFLDAYEKGDGTRKKGKVWKGYLFSDEVSFSTTSDQLASDLGEVILKLGKTPSYCLHPIKTTTFSNGTYTSNHPVWRVVVTSKRASRVGTVQKGQEYYKGVVYDVELEKHHTLIVRRNGKVCISGNCRCDIRPILSGQEWDEKNKRYATVAPEPLQERKGKIKIRVGDQNFEV